MPKPLHHKLKLVLLLILIGNTGTLLAQDESDSLKLEDDIDYSILALDSMLLDEFGEGSLVGLLDSLLKIDYNQSQFAFRLGFTSDVVSAGRDLGIKQKGLTPGISYYHKSGVFASITGYWNSEFSPKYNLTAISAGYLGVVKDKLIYTASYERTIYHQSAVNSSDIVDEVSNPFKHTLGVGASYDLKYLFTGVDYAYIFGDETTHRLRWNVSGYLKKKEFLFFDYLLFRPEFSLLIGQENITLTTFNLREQYQQTDKAALLREINSLGYTLASFRDLRAVQKEAILRNLLAPESSVFGLMNYGFSAPITFRKKNWSFTLSYNYNIPVQLPGEDIEFSPSGYIGMNLIHYLKL
ncbi:MAG: hypothetical protein O2887_14105 [Bacteroidetes bacterium]|nr:hypothetical protein [Bacteroidota bacterium]MDA1121602.1 hypothetical protein [Bacteroidota bacterium]